MFFVTVLALAATTVLGSPVELQPRTAALSLKHVTNITSVKNIVNKGQSRIKAINGVKVVGPVSDVSSGSITNEDVSYVAPVVIGGKTWELIVDTGCKLLSHMLKIFLKWNSNSG